jgi:exopolysaccharide biosynthesis protein
LDGFVLLKKENSKQLDNRNFKKKLYKSTVFFIVFQFIFICITLPLLVFYGPFENVKSIIVGTSMNSSKYQFLARFFLSDKAIDKIMIKNSAKDPTQDGEELKTLNFVEKHSNKIEVFDIKGSDIAGKMMIVYDPTSIVIGLSGLLPKSGETTSEIAKRNNAMAAINASGFTDNGWVGTGGSPIGFIIHDSKVIYNQIKNEKEKQDSVAFTVDGMLIVGKHTIEQLKKYGVKEAVSFGPPLIVNGKKTITKGDGGWGIAPRTAIGQLEDGKVLFLVIDGRNLDSIGATLKQVQDILFKYGAVNAVNLDGGSSTTMYFNGKVINKPSDRLGERSIPSVFMVIPTKQGGLK